MKNMRTEQETIITTRDTTPDVTLIEALILEQVRSQLTHAEFAIGLGFDPVTWLSYRRGSRPSTKLYDVVLRLFPKLEPKVYRHLKWWADQGEKEK